MESLSLAITFFMIVIAYEFLKPKETDTSDTPSRDEEEG